MTGTTSPPLHDLREQGFLLLTLPWPVGGQPAEMCSSTYHMNRKKRIESKREQTRAMGVIAKSLEVEQKQHNTVQ